MASAIEIFANSIFIKPRLNLKEWSETYRVLSRESSANYGKFKSMNYQIEPMLEISNKKRQKIVLLWASQLGKSEIINNMVGYYIHQEPSSMLFMLPSQEDAERYSKQRLAPMIRDCRPLSELINANDANNTILVKNYRGGFLELVGSNSVSKLASKPIKILLVDEADRCEKTKEGDAIKLAEKRTITFSDRKIIISSTPTLKGASTIESEFENSDQRYYFVKCPECHREQTLLFSNLKWGKHRDGTPNLDSVRYQCVGCGALLNESQKNQMVKSGVWKATNPASNVAGFFLNALYSPFFKLKDIAKDFLESVGDATKLQTFKNTIEAVSFEPPSVTFNVHALYSRKEDYDETSVPAKVKFITAGADVQDDRVEVLFCGWTAAGFECFNIKHEIVEGNTDGLEVWEKLKKTILRRFRTDDGRVLIASIILIDSGFRPSAIYNFATTNSRVVATKGLSEIGGEKADFIQNLQRKKLQNGKPFLYMPIGTFKGKSELFRLLSIEQAGEGYFHYGRNFSNEFFLQLTAEKLQRVKNKNGYEKLQFVKVRERNEALDISVLNLAAAKIFFNSLRKKRKVSQR